MIIKDSATTTMHQKNRTEWSNTAFSKKKDNSRQLATLLRGLPAAPSALPACKRATPAVAFGARLRRKQKNVHKARRLLSYKVYSDFLTSRQNSLSHFRYTERTEFGGWFLHSRFRVTLHSGQAADEVKIGNMMNRTHLFPLSVTPASSIKIPYKIAELCTTTARQTSF